VAVTSVGDRGPQGDTGPATTLSIGTVTTGAAGSNASATMTGAAPNQTLSLTIPRGDTGSTGATGASVELQTTSTHVQWRLVGGSTWTNLIALSAITGPQGSTGAAGANIELQTTSTHVQWRLVGGSTWTNLIALSAITGPQGSHRHCDWRRNGVGHDHRICPQPDVEPRAAEGRQRHGRG
jgi:hypothetical protein